MYAKNKKVLVYSTLFATVLVLLLFATGLPYYWSGIKAIADNTTDFSVERSHKIKGEYSIPIDLSKLESNLGKELYNDGTHRIYVSFVDNSGDVSSGGFRIGFRFSGEYSFSHATLISGVQHSREANNSFSSNMSAKMTSEHNGKLYHCPIFSESGINYKDGDEFGFYIFPTSAYEDHDISLNEKGIVNITVTDLYKNDWSKNNILYKEEPDEYRN
ncbi:hypothetical protein [Lederbergia citri]|uniref:Uncharacterized protein n=1 Tax=Lederbergia citri TaxID=2833580 RepID=A0A942TDI1_9BACI|nr:hypothetical protein [Lederbergia citri]MBS4194272.1 hypothetical protein [Lederbergia citri]